MDLEEGNIRARWGLIEIVLVYLGIFIVTNLVGYYSMRSLWVQGRPLLQFTLVAGVQFMITIALVIIFTLVSKQASWKDLGVTKASARDLLVYGGGAGLGLLLLMLILSWPLSKLHPNIAPQLFETMLRSADNGWTFVLLFLMGAVLAPVSEEMFYRAMIYPYLRGVLGKTWGIVLAGAIFGLAHWDLWRALPLAVGGSILCYLYEKTGSILVPITAHGVWNGVMSWLVFIKIPV
jgi:hypothetical protein